MSNTFDNWDGTGEEIAHYGIPGMKWGVRRYMNKDGTLTEAGKTRYGATGRGASPRRMTKDFNRLDRSYANMEARRSSEAQTAGKYAQKMNRAKAKGDEAKAEKYSDKARKHGEKAGQYNKNKTAIESLQWKIIGKAASKGWTIDSEPVTRMASDGKTKVASILAGPLGRSIYGVYKKGRNTADVSGQNILVSRRGNRKQNVVNYAAYRSADVKAQMRKNQVEELAKQAGGYRR